MENKQSLSKKAVISQNIKFVPDIANPLKGNCCRRKLCLDIETPTKDSINKISSQRIIVSIQPVLPTQASVAIEENIIPYTQETNDSITTLSISSVTEKFNGTHPIENCKKISDIDTKTKVDHIAVFQTTSEYTGSTRKCRNQNTTKYYEENIFEEECSVYSSPKPFENISEIKLEPKLSMNQLLADINCGRHTLVIKELTERINRLEIQVKRQENLLHSMNRTDSATSADEDSSSNMKSASSSSRPGCSYVEQYSHIPETSAFHKFSQQAPLSRDKITVIETKQDTEQYGRDFTTYDGITSRGRHQCSSAPYRRSEAPRAAAERVHKIRHRLNPVRDYRLMDTVNYLAQGEFASRDDGIKLTPSREAVLSDIIWEDVCRTHWPSTKLGSRGQSERGSTRYELQRLIDSLLRERVAHVERRRRRHYRIVKLNQRQENVRTLGKTGDIIVASHKNRSDILSPHHNSNNTLSAERKLEEFRPRRNQKSDDHLSSPERRERRRFTEEECAPGPSCVSHCERDQTYLCHTKHRKEHDMSSADKNISLQCKLAQERNPRLVIKQEKSRRRSVCKKDPDLEHLIVLPTLVVRTPSNLKRQKKFNELYHRALNATEGLNETGSRRKITDDKSNGNCEKKDVSFNINITLSNSAENIVKK